jgi:hypothetical protein
MGSPFRGRHLLVPPPITSTNHSTQHHQHPPSPSRSRPSGSPPIPPFAPDRVLGPDPLPSTPSAPRQIGLRRRDVREHTPAGRRRGLVATPAELTSDNEMKGMPSHRRSAMGKSHVVVAIGPGPPTGHHEGGATIGAGQTNLDFDSRFAGGLLVVRFRGGQSASGAGVGCRRKGG